MLQSIIDYLIIKLQALQIAEVYGLGELVVEAESEKPALYIGSGQYTSLANFDNHSGLMYFRLVSPVSNTVAESQVGGEDVFQRTYNLRIVAYVNKEVYNTDNNYIDDKIAHNIQLAIDNEDDGLLSTSLGAQTATIQTISYETNRRNVSDGESLGFDIPFNYVFLALDFNVVIIGSQDCFSTYGCNDTPIDYLDLLRAEICETECLDGTVTATNTLGTQIGSVSVPSGGNANIPITDSLARRSDLTTIVSIPAETNVTIADSPITLQNTASTVLSVTNVKADSSATITAPDATGTAKNSIGTTIGTGSAPSGGSGNINVADSLIKRSDNSTIVSNPAAADYTVADTPVRVEYVNGTLISNTNVKAASTATIQVPNQLTLQDNVNSSTSTQIVTAITNAGKECDVQSQLLDRYKVNGFASIGSFGTLAGSNGAAMVYNGLIYITSLNNVLIYSATTYALQTTVTGFNGAVEMAMSPDGSQYAVVNFTGNTVRIMDTATNTQITSFATITNPWTVSYNAAGTELYISTLTTSSITRYNLAGSTLGTVAGFDGRILEVRRVGLNYHVLTATGTAGASTQRVRVMDFATNTEQSSNPLGTVTTIGTVQSIAIEGSSAYLCALKGSGNSTTLFVYEYNLSYVLQRGENTCINGTNLWGVAYNPANCGTLVLPCTTLTTTINLIV